MEKRRQVEEERLTKASAALSEAERQKLLEEGWYKSVCCGGRVTFNLISSSKSPLVLDTSFPYWHHFFSSGVKVGLQIGISHPLQKSKYKLSEVPILCVHVLATHLSFAMECFYFIVYYLLAHVGSNTYSIEWMLQWYSPLFRIVDFCSILRGLFFALSSRAVSLKLDLKCECVALLLWACCCTKSII